MLVKEEILKMSNLSFGYSDQKMIIDHCSASFLANQIYVLLGKNGVGKTTLLNLLANNLVPTKGEITYQIEMANIGYMSDTFFYYNGMTLIDMAEVIQTLRTIEKKQALKQMNNYLEFLDLEEYRNMDIDNLSFGTKKRVHLLLTLLHDPQLLILDEPTNGLDPEQIIKFKRNINFLKEQGKTVIISTHSVKIAEDISDKTILLSKRILMDIASGANIEKEFLRLS
ncbi:ATP-binding cassette domain-containing protein [Enterococcus sp. DIV1420a]|uniref:ATP-binding cassette domain-containing protein n=1 Tax=Enterococcus sp. DIV1420a TaxID=2774672 RepID=UPI003F223509